MEAVELRISLLTDQLNLLNLGGLQVDDISTTITVESKKKVYQWGKNHALSRWGEHWLFFDCRSGMNKQLLLNKQFHSKFKE